MFDWTTDMKMLGVSSSAPSVVASWCRCATTQRRAACWLGSSAVPTWPPWTLTATLTPSSKCKSQPVNPAQIRKQFEMFQYELKNQQSYL